MTTPQSMREEFEQLKHDLGEVPENTCPDIDKALKELSSLANDVSYLQKGAHRYESAEDLAKDFPDVGWLDTPDILEKLRKDNDQLRSLGREWYQFAKSLIERLPTLEAAARAEEREAVLMKVARIPKMEFKLSDVKQALTPTNPPNN